MLCACSGEQFRFDDQPGSPESLATRDFSASGLSSSTRTRGGADWDSKLEESQVDEAESTLKEALSLNYEEARALLGRLEYQRGNFDAALQVFKGIDIKVLTPRIIKAIGDRTRPCNKPPRSSKALTLPPPSSMSMHSVSLLLEAILLKARSLEELGSCKEAAEECKLILDMVESALPSGMPRVGISGFDKLQEVFHKALELLPLLWTKAGDFHETVASYRRALSRPWNLDPQRLAVTQKSLALVLLYGSVEASPKDSMEEAIVLLMLLVKKMVVGGIQWDGELVDHLAYALSMVGQFDVLASYMEQILPGVYTRGGRWYLLSLCYSAAGMGKTAINLLKLALGPSESRQIPQASWLLFGAKLCSEDPQHSRDGIYFSHRLLDLANNQSEHLLSQAHRFLGVCYGNAARSSKLDSERVLLQKKSLYSLNKAATMAKGDPEPDAVYNLSVENAFQRNLQAALDGAVEYSSMVGGGVSTRGWKHLAAVLSAEKRLKDAESILDFTMEEAGDMEKLDLLKLKAVLQMAQEQPKQALKTCSNFLALIRAQEKSEQSETLLKKYETEAWQDLASVYRKLGSLSDAETCLDKARSISFYSPRGWNETGLCLEAKSLHEEALIAFFMSLSIDPDHVPSIVSIAEVMMKSGGDTLATAKSFLMNALRLDPRSHDAWMKLGHVAKMQGLSQQAAEFYQAAYELELSAPVQSFI